MSAALQLPTIWGSTQPQPAWEPGEGAWKAGTQDTIKPVKPAPAAPIVSLGFYRRHTEKMLRRYLYASMQVGRSPSIFDDPVSRGWASSRPVRTFEDVVIFVLDMEKCLDQLNSLDRQLLSRIVLQEYTHAEVSTLLGMSTRSVCSRLPQAIDRLTEKLLDAGLLVLPS
jgi:hypothetical protein